MSGTDRTGLHAEVRELSLSLSLTRPGDARPTGPELTGPELTGPELTGPELTGPELTGTVVDGLGTGGRHPDLPDHRDEPWQAAQEGADGLPDRVDLRRDEVHVYDQGRLPACTSNAVAAAVQYLQHREGGDAPRPSRMFLYWNERQRPEGADHVGVSLRSGLKALAAHGVCPAEVWPYRAHLLRRPPATAFAQARYAGEVRYARLPVTGGSAEQALEPVRRCLAAGLPVLFGLSVYDNLRHVGPDGRVPAPRSGARLLFGHAALLVGYETREGATVFLCQNSWGRDWGDRGFFRVDASYLADHHLAQDFWTVTSLES